MTVLALPTFGGGIVLEGSADVQRTDELRECDSYDIGSRGQLVAASDRTAAFAIASLATLLYGMEMVQIPQKSFLLLVGDGAGSTTVTTINLDGTNESSTPIVATLPGGIIVTFGALPFVGADQKQKRVILVNMGARSGQHPNNAAGLWALVYDPAAGSYLLSAISKYDALGTGAQGEKLGGTKAQQLYPRGIVIYNNHAWLWGFDQHDTTNRDGPNRLMFSNIGNPLKYGNDPAGSDPTLVGTDRDFVDSDAFTIGGAGAAIRAGLVWNSKLWVATNIGLHYVEGFGRESFLTNGALPIAQSRNAVGAHALCEGPDRLLHGVSDEGHWIFDGASFATPGDRLRQFGTSLGYWDLIWSNPASGVSFPGKTNQDLVWMLAVPELMQVWIGIPYCGAALGYGQGGDTVILKYHCLTGGYTRQQFLGTIITAADLYKRDQTAVAQLLLAVPGGAPNLQRYGYRTTGAAAPVMPAAATLAATFGEYAPHGVLGTGVVRKFYFTISWDTAALPLAFQVVPSIDGTPTTPIVVTIQAGVPPGTAPAAPAHGDLWVDTSGTDMNLGNGTAGAFTPAQPGAYLLKRWHAGWAKWVNVPGMGQQGTRVTIPVAHDTAVGTRIKYRVTSPVATGRYQIEGVGFGPPETIRSGA